MPYERIEIWKCGRWRRTRDLVDAVCHAEMVQRGGGRVIIVSLIRGQKGLGAAVSTHSGIPYATGGMDSLRR